MLALSVLLVGLNLRPIFSSLSTLLPEVIQGTGMSKATASLLSTLPLLCLGVFAWPTPKLVNRFGAERALLGALVFLSVGTLLRWTDSVPVLFIASGLAGAGIAVGNVLLPAIIKREFRQTVGMMMGLYTLAVCAGAAGAAALTVPIEHALGGSWRGALAAWALPALISLGAWIPFAKSRNQGARELGRSHAVLVRRGLAWHVTLFMGLQSSLAYIVMSWLSPILRERGLDSVTAGYVVGVSIFFQLVTCLLTPAIATRLDDQRIFSIGVTVIVLAGLMAMLFAPLGGVWVWAALLGIGQGASFALALMLIVLRSPSVEATSELSAMAQGWGYILASLGPFTAGLLNSLTGGFNATAVFMTGIALAMAWSGWLAGRRLHVQVRR